MRTIETTVTVDDEGTATLRLPLDIPPGKHKAVVVLDETANRPARRLSFASHDVGPWPFGPEETIQREDLYDDDGR